MQAMSGAGADRVSGGGLLWEEEGQAARGKALGHWQISIMTNGKYQQAAAGSFSFLEADAALDNTHIACWQTLAHM